MYANTTLKRMSKSELIEVIRLLEEDVRGLTETNDNQVRLLGALLDGRDLVRNGNMVIVKKR